MLYCPAKLKISPLSYEISLGNGRWEWELTGVQMDGCVVTPGLRAGPVCCAGYCAAGVN